MDVRYIILAVLTQFRFTLSAHVSGIITENTTFYYQKLPVAPSVSTTIEFSISYLQSAMRYRYPLMGIYTTYPELNIKKSCSYVQYAQLHNENLHPYLGVGRYKTTTCELSGSDTVNCSGIVTVQDYMPRNFYLTFGFHCDYPSISLSGLVYNISFSNQRNGTSGCVDYTDLHNTIVCSRLYSQTSFPNLMGVEQLDEIEDFLIMLQTYEFVIHSHGSCHQHLFEIMCRTMLPECNPASEQLIHPCREMCSDLLEACLQKWYSLAIDLGTTKDKLPKGNLSRIYCDYFPSIHGDVPCFYNPVKCNSPPDVTDGTMILNVTQKVHYQLHDVVQYACVNNTLK